MSKKTNYVYVTKSINTDMTSHHGGKFKYPKRGYVEALDWKDNRECGNGLHGFLWGEGDGGLAAFNDSKWLLIRVNPEDGMVELGDKCKFKRGYVLKTGDVKEITEELKKYLPKDRIFKVIGGTATAGNYGTATAGNYGTATAGDEGTATAGYKGTATAGYKGTATAGYKGTATAGNYGTATAGDEGTATAGNYGNILIQYYDNKNGVYRFKCGCIGENGLKPNTPYRLNDSMEFVEVIK